MCSFPITCPLTHLAHAAVPTLLHILRLPLGPLQELAKLPLQLVQLALRAKLRGQGRELKEEQTSGILSRLQACTSATQGNTAAE